MFLAFREHRTPNSEPKRAGRFCLVLPGRRSRAKAGAQPKGRPRDRELEIVFRSGMLRGVSNADLTEAIAKLETLSDSRAKRVVSLIEDLTELEALENTADLKAARDVLAESEKPLPWEQVKAKLDAQFGFPQPTS